MKWRSGDGETETGEQRRRNRDGGAGTEFERTWRTRDNPQHGDTELRRQTEKSLPARRRAALCAAVARGRTHTPVKDYRGRVTWVWGLIRATAAGRRPARRLADSPVTLRVSAPPC